MMNDNYYLIIMDHGIASLHILLPPPSTAWIMDRNCSLKLCAVCRPNFHSKQSGAGHATRLQQVQALGADAADAVGQLVLRPVGEARLVVWQVAHSRPDLLRRRLQRPVKARVVC